MTDEIRDEARKAIMDGKSTPIDRESKGPGSRVHLVKLKNGKTIKVIYNRFEGEIKEILPV